MQVCSSGRRANSGFSISSNLRREGEVEHFKIAAQEQLLHIVGENSEDDSFPRDDDVPMLGKVQECTEGPRLQADDTDADVPVPMV